MPTKLITPAAACADRDCDQEDGRGLEPLKAHPEMKCLGFAKCERVEPAGQEWASRKH